MRPDPRPLLLIAMAAVPTCSIAPAREPMPQPKSIDCPSWAYSVPVPESRYRLPPIDISSPLIKCIDRAWKACTSGRVDYRVEVGTAGQVLRVVASGNGFAQEARCVEATIATDMLLEPVLDCRGVGLPSLEDGYVAWSTNGIVLSGLATDGVVPASPLCAVPKRGITMQ